MNDTWTIDTIWWISAVELPALAGLFWLVWRTRRDIERDVEAIRHDCEAGVAGSREGLAAYKLEVAKSYASLAYLGEVERRITRHLTRIENKLDSQCHATAMGGER